jgi:hypothetical protein
MDGRGQARPIFPRLPRDGSSDRRQATPENFFRSIQNEYEALPKSPRLAPYCAALTPTPVPLRSS